MNGKFVIILKELVTDPRIDAYEYRILSYLISCSKDGECFPSHGDISDKTGIPVSTVKRKLDSLISKKYISKSNRTIGSGKRTSNIYTINKKYLVTREARYETNEKQEELFDYDWIGDE